MNLTDLPPFAPLSYLRKKNPAQNSDYFLSVVTHIPAGYEVSNESEKQSVEANTYLYDIFVKKSTGIPAHPYFLYEKPIFRSSEEIKNIKISVHFEEGVHKTVMFFDHADPSGAGLRFDEKILGNKPYGYLKTQNKEQNLYQFYYAYFYQGLWQTTKPATNSPSGKYYVGFSLNRVQYESEIGCMEIQRNSESLLDAYVQEFGNHFTAFQPVTDGSSIYDFEDADE